MTSDPSSRRSQNDLLDKFKLKTESLPLISENRRAVSDIPSVRKFLKQMSHLESPSCLEPRETSSVFLVKKKIGFAAEPQLQQRRIPM